MGRDYRDGGHPLTALLLADLLTTGGHPGISDGVDGPAAPAARTFPYLAPPGVQP